MNTTEMRTRVRRDLKDEDAGSYRWSSDELDRHISHAVKEFSEAIPYERKGVLATVSGSREIDASSLTDRVMIEAVEYPVNQFPRRYQRFALWGETVTLLGDEIPDGSNANIYYGKLHTLGDTSTIPAIYEDLVAAGAAGYAAVEWAVYATNRVNVGGAGAPAEFLAWGRERLEHFKEELKRLGRRSRVRVRNLYRPYHAPVSRTTDYGP